MTHLYKKKRKWCDAIWFSIPAFLRFYRATSKPNRRMYCASVFESTAVGIFVNEDQYLNAWLKCNDRNVPCTIGKKNANRTEFDGQANFLASRQNNNIPTDLCVKHKCHGRHFLSIAADDRNRIFFYSECNSYQHP